MYLVPSVVTSISGITSTSNDEISNVCLEELNSWPILAAHLEIERISLKWPIHLLIHSAVKDLFEANIQTELPRS
uniref:RDR904 n=1 Tax=Arundo donax TaxID=35708 RepID=A0A0A9D3V2_ARUDO